jgi:hypothetical protein
MIRITTTKVGIALASLMVLGGIDIACSSSSSGGSSDDSDSGSASADEASTDDGGGPAATIVPCPTLSQPNVVCNTATQYCMQTGAVLDGGYYQSSASCFYLPTGCDSCDCIDAGGAWMAKNTIGDNCRSDPMGPVKITCTDESGAITARCTKTLR